MTTSLTVTHSLLVYLPLALQAEDRAYRMGQTRPVTVHKLLSPGTIEHHMADTADGKMSLVRTLMTLSEKNAGGGGGGGGGAGAGGRGDK